ETVVAVQAAVQKELQALRSDMQDLQRHQSTAFARGMPSRAQGASTTVAAASQRPSRGVADAPMTAGSSRSPMTAGSSRSPPSTRSGVPASQAAAPHLQDLLDLSNPRILRHRTLAEGLLLGGPRPSTGPGKPSPHWKPPPQLDMCMVP
ncbi:hypothetical protein CYMTET_45876, partial [Cymbomonas tetramitiformis]